MDWFSLSMKSIQELRNEKWRIKDPWRHNLNPWIQLFLKFTSLLNYCFFENIQLSISYWIYCLIYCPNVWDNKLSLFICCLFSQVWVIFLFLTTKRDLSSIFLNNVAASPPRPNIILHSSRGLLGGKEDVVKTNNCEFWKCINNTTGILVPYVRYAAVLKSQIFQYDIN